jgi:hypothetical protein
MRPLKASAVSAIDVGYWHGADIKPRPVFGRYRVESGHHWLVPSIYAYDPLQTSVAPCAAARVLLLGRVAVSQRRNLAWRREMLFDAWFTGVAFLGKMLVAKQFEFAA